MIVLISFLNQKQDKCDSMKSKITLADRYSKQKKDLLLVILDTWRCVFVVLDRKSVV